MRQPPGYHRQVGDFPANFVVRDHRHLSQRFHNFSTVSYCNIVFIIGIFATKFIPRACQNGNTTVWILLACLYQSPPELMQVTQDNLSRLRWSHVTRCKKESYKYQCHSLHDSTFKPTPIDILHIGNYHPAICMFHPETKSLFNLKSSNNVAMVVFFLTAGDVLDN